MITEKVSNNRYLLNLVAELMCLVDITYLKVMHVRYMISCNTLVGRHGRDLLTVTNIDVSGQPLYSTEIQIPSRQFFIRILDLLTQAVIKYKPENYNILNLAFSKIGRLTR
jgi:hypothetical protein